MYTITAQQAYDHVKQLVAERPDFVYPNNPYWRFKTPSGDLGSRRYYLPNGKPGCIVGRVLHRLGIPREFVQEQIHFRALAEFWDRKGNVQVSPAARSLLHHVQYHQDSGRTWREAFDKAVESLDARTEDEPSFDPISRDWRTVRHLSGG